jgi:hypothetical protein
VSWVWILLGSGGDGRKKGRWAARVERAARVLRFSWLLSLGCIYGTRKEQTHLQAGIRHIY